MNYNQTPLSRISNTIYLITSSFVLSFIWINFYFRNLKKSLILSIIVTLILTASIIIIQRFNKKRKIINQTKLNEINNIKKQILYGKDHITIDIIKKAYNLNNLTKSHDTNHLIDNINHIDYYFCFDKEIINEETLIQVFKTKKFNNITLFCIESSITTKLKNINITILNLDQIIQQTSLANLKIDQQIEIEKKPKYSIKEIICIILNKNKSRSYLGFGSLLIFSSLFTPFSIYYISIGTILILLSIYSRYNKRFNQKTNN